MIFYSCNPKVKHSGLNDLFVGVHQIVFYEDETFYLELGLGGNGGTYKILHDTIHLQYNKKAKILPERIIMTDTTFMVLNAYTKSKQIIIKRKK